MQRVVFLQSDIANKSFEYFGAWGVSIALCLAAVVWLALEVKSLRAYLQEMQKSKDELTKDCLNALNSYSSAIEKQTIVESNAKQVLAEKIQQFQQAVEKNQCRAS